MPWVHYVVQVASKNHIFNWNKLGGKQSSNEKKQRELLLPVYLRAFPQLLNWENVITEKHATFLPIPCPAGSHLKQVILERFF